VFDGVWAHVAGAGRGSFNQRFAQPSRDGQPIANVFYPTDVFPFTGVEEVKARPKVFYTNGSYEYWGRAASLIHTSPDGKQDAPIPSATRIYFNTSAQHGPGQFPPARTNTRNLSDPLDYRWQMRALLAAMNAWLKDGKEPPASRYPRIATGELVARGKLAFPALAALTPPRAPHTPYHLDFGPDFATKGIATIEPPQKGEPFQTLVPQVNSDGIDRSGIRLPEVEVPLGTYTGWNFRDAKLGAPDEMIAFTGSFLPFAQTEEQRRAANDPRPSLAARYTDKATYLSKIDAVTNTLVQDGFLLPQDAPKLHDRASQQWDYVTKPE
jgi:hypothetical protein